MTEKYFSCLLLFLLSAVTVYSQQLPAFQPVGNWQDDLLKRSPYTGLTSPEEIPETGLKLRTTTGFWRSAYHAITGLDIDAANPGTSTEESVSDLLAKGTMLLPFALLANPEIRRDAGRVSVHLSETFLLTYGTVRLTRIFSQGNHYYLADREIPLEKRLRPSNGGSFFTGHTSLVASLSFFTASVWTDYHADSRYKPVAWSAAAALPAVSAYLQYKAGRQDMTELGTEMLIGAIAGYIIPNFHKIDLPSKRKLRLSSSLIDNVPVFTIKYRL